MNSGQFAPGRYGYRVLQMKLQVPHIVRVLGGDRFVRPERNDKGVALMPMAKKKAKKATKKKAAKKAKKKKK
ncbi:MAG: hypothetical protein JSR60_15885 [Proteobacteria bacterium]|nr:hypothetical protein [Pseudomonadota bacterium]